MFKYLGPKDASHDKRPHVPPVPARDITEKDLATKRAKRDGWEALCKASPLYEEEKPKPPASTKVKEDRPHD
jgi:hypothetical protein